MNKVRLLRALEEYKKFNYSEFFNPYEFQKEFINAGKYFRQRAFCAGNRVGKTEIGAYEMACHLTGRYPGWWDGYRCDKSGYEFVCVGITLQSTAKILQKKLFGTNDCRDVIFGSGTIPRDCIVMDPMEKDGGRIVSVSIRHKDGGTNKLFFFSAADEKKIMGMTLKGCWLDESDKTQCGKLYSQCVRRVVTTKGFVLQTFTPENGVDDVVRKFINAQSPEDKGYGKLYFQQASMYDAHVNVGGHLTDDDIAEVSSGCSEFELDCVIHGIPSAGRGACFPLKDDEFREDDDITPEDDWPIIASVDIGKVVDPTVVSFVTTNPLNNITYLLKQIYLKGGAYDKDAKSTANAILESEYPHALVIVPHDAGLKSTNPEAFGKMLENYGANVYTNHPFRNPDETLLTASVIKQSTGASVRGIETGLREMRARFKEGTFKVCKECTEWWKEKQTYFYNEHGEPVDANNHCIDSSRYGFLTIIGGIHCTVAEAKSGVDNNWRKAQVKSLRF